ncbi:ribosomal protein L7/L12 C-terminal domain-containing protein [Cladochytrium replicatum]|nr:ribosomal protein L7/L12 C-terminal domain-containing protein [Cladochytrium replicatum]
MTAFSFSVAVRRVAGVRVAASHSCVIPLSTALARRAPARYASTEKIAQLTEQIAGLTLIETNELVESLKSRLNIQQISMPQVAAAPQVVAAAPAAAPAEAEPAPPPKEEKNEVKVKLEKIDEAAKAKVIREIKTIIPGMNLVEAKKFVESIPKVIKEGVPKAEAEKMKKALEAVGAVVVFE